MYRSRMSHVQACVFIAKQIDAIYICVCTCSVVDSARVLAQALRKLPPPWYVDDHPYFSLERLFAFTGHRQQRELTRT